MKRRLIMFLVCCSLVAYTACVHNGSNSEDGNSEKETHVDSSIGEGAPPNDAIEFDESQEHLVGEKIVVSSELVEYELTIDSVSYTTMRNQYAEEPKHVILIDYTYTNCADKLLLIDTMSFQLLNAENTVYEPYYFAEKITAEVAEKGKTISAQIAFAQNDDQTELTLVYQDVADSDIEPIPIIINKIENAE